MTWIKDYKPVEDELLLDLGKTDHCIRLDNKPDKYDNMVVDEEEFEEVQIVLPKEE